MYRILNYTFVSLDHFYHPPTMLLGLIPPTCVNFRHTLATVSGRHGADGYALDRFCYFIYVRIRVWGTNNYPYNDLERPPPDIDKD